MPPAAAASELQAGAAGAGGGVAAASAGRGSAEGNRSGSGGRGSYAAARATEYAQSDRLRAERPAARRATEATPDASDERRACTVASGPEPPYRPSASNEEAELVWTRARPPGACRPTYTSRTSALPP